MQMKVKRETPGRGQLLQLQVLDDVDAVASQQDEVTGELAAELWIA